MYEAHPSATFARRPYQGVEPPSAAYLFIGLDANYDPHIERNSIFRRVLEYHDDGAGFWRRHGVHHPFLLPEYKGDGRRYHKNFARIGFGPEHAELVSFVELLHVPTIGRNQRLEPTDLRSSHLQMLSSAMLGGKPKHIFVSAGVVRLMHATRAFPWLSKKPTAGSGRLPVLYSSADRKVYLHLHFSNWWGKFQQRAELEANAIASNVARRGPKVKALLAFTETILRIAMKVVLVTVAGFIALIAALTWRK
jgi:hypothetical protein